MTLSDAARDIRDLDLFLDKIWDISAVGLGSIQEPMPQTFFIQTPDDAVHVLMTPWDSDLEKMMYLSAVRKHLHEHNAARYVLMSEAWMSVHESKDGSAPPDSPRPSEDPNRREVMMAVAVDRRTGYVRFRTATMTRNADGTATLGEINHADGGKQFGGLMASLFDQPVEDEYSSSVRTIEMPKTKPESEVLH